MCHRRGVAAAGYLSENMTHNGPLFRDKCELIHCSVNRMRPPMPSVISPSLFTSSSLQKRSRVIILSKEIFLLCLEFKFRCSTLIHQVAFHLCHSSSSPSRLQHPANAPFIHACLTGAHHLSHLVVHPLVLFFVSHDSGLQVDHLTLVFLAFRLSVTCLSPCLARLSYRIRLMLPRLACLVLCLGRRSVSSLGGASAFASRASFSCSEAPIEYQLTRVRLALSLTLHFLAVWSSTLCSDVFGPTPEMDYSRPSVCLQSRHNGCLLWWVAPRQFASSFLGSVHQSSAARF